MKLLFSLSLRKMPCNACLTTLGRVPSPTSHSRDALLITDGFSTPPRVPCCHPTGTGAAGLAPVASPAVSGMQ